MNERAEACKIAGRMARYRGGKTSDYMADAWREVREQRHKNKEQFKNRSRITTTSTTNYPMRYRSTSKKKTKHVTEKAKALARNVDFMKAPNDKPMDVFSGVRKMFTKRAEGINVPPAVKNELKKMFKFW